MQALDEYHSLRNCNHAFNWRAGFGALSRSTKSKVRIRFRAEVVLLAASWMGTREISRVRGYITGRVSKWRVRYARDRLAGLEEAGVHSAAAKYGSAHQKRILGMLDHTLPDCSNWTAPLLVRALGGIDEQYIWRFLHAQKIDLSGHKF